MTFGRPLLMLIGVGMVGTGATSARQVETSPPIPETVAQRVRAAIATEWQVEAERVVLTWSRPLTPPAPDVVPTVRGTGRSSRFAVSLRAGGKERGSMVTTVRAGLRVVAPVAVRTLRRGAVLEPDDLVPSETIVWGPPDAAPEFARAGWIVRTTVSSGELLARPAVVPPPDVHAGQEVEVVWTRSTLAVVMTGMALHDARVGERLQVRLNNQRGSVRTTVVVGGRARLEGGE